MASIYGNLRSPVGEQVYTTPGTYTFTVPDYVYRVSAVCVGAGGGGTDGALGGGGLGWKNNISVVPGQTLSVVVGNSPTNSGGIGQDSWFISTTTVRGQGAQGTTGGGYVGDGGGNGGNGTGGGAYLPKGGGGAGGYTGNGGNGSSNTNGQSGSGGGGGGGTTDSSGYNGGGGGVGLYGQGANGAGGIYNNFSNEGKGGSGGENGGSNTANNRGGDYGGGASGSASGGTGFRGGYGAVRIMWGQGRSFPFNAEYRAPSSLASRYNW